MKVRVQRAIDRVVGDLLCRMLSLYWKWFTNHTPADRPQKILVILLSEMGSLVLAYPMFKQLKTDYPDSTICVLLFEKNREMLELLNVIPGENILTVSDRSLPRFLLDSLRAIFAMRSRAIDTVVDCELFARVSSIFSFFSGARIRSGFAPYTQEGLYRGSFIDRPVLYNPYLHISHQYLTLVDALGSKTVPTAKRRITEDRMEAPRFEPDADEFERIIGRLFRDYPVCRNRKLILIYPGGGVLPIRAWPLENYCRITSELVEDGYAVGIIGLRSDRELAKEIVQDCMHPRCIDLTGYTRSIGELLNLFCHAELLITNDGGPGQFAAMTPIATIIFYGPETPALYGSHAQNVHFFYSGLSCSPCLTAYNHRNSPCDGDNQCLKSIQPDQVLSKAREMLECSTQTVTKLRL